MRPHQGAITGSKETPYSLTFKLVLKTLLPNVHSRKEHIFHTTPSVIPRKGVHQQILGELSGTTECSVNSPRFKPFCAASATFLAAHISCVMTVFSSRCIRIYDDRFIFNWRGSAQRSSAWSWWQLQDWSPSCSIHIERDSIRSLRESY